MKLLVILSSLIALAFQSFAVDTVVVNTATSITVNGVESGKPADTIRNRPELASSIQLALEKWEADKATELSALKTEVEKLKARRAEVLAAMRDRLEKLPTEARTALVEALAFVERPEREKRKAELAAELAAKQKELDALK